MVPLGPLGSTVGTTRRQALIAAAATLPGRTGGDTGLYNTVLGAYNAVRTGYDPAAANSVVLLTDGSNTQTAGIDLATLLDTLRVADDVRARRCRSSRSPSARTRTSRRCSRSRPRPAARR